MKTKCIIIKDNTHKALRHYCLDHSTTIIDAATEIINQHLHQKGYSISMPVNQTSNYGLVHDIAKHSGNK